MAIWLMKTEPDTFSIWDLQKRKDQTEPWTGVRGFHARNYMSREMKIGDDVLFYHSSCKPPGVIGLATVVTEAYPDPTAVDPRSDYFDPKLKPGKNHWRAVDVKFKREFKRLLSLHELKEVAGLEDMMLFKAARLSIQPVAPAEFAIILKLAEA